MAAVDGEVGSPSWQRSRPPCRAKARRSGFDTAIEVLGRGDVDGWLALFDEAGVRERLEIGTLCEVQTMRDGEDTVVRVAGGRRPSVLRGTR